VAVAWRHLAARPWLHSGWRGLLKLAALIAATALVTIVGLVVTGVWNGIWRDEPEDPVHLRVETGPRDALSGGAVIPRRISQLPPPPEIRGRVVSGTSTTPIRCPTLGWVRGLGGAETETTFMVYLEGRSERTVILDRADVEVVRRHPPMRGTFVNCGPGARVAVRRLRVNLGSRPARAVYLDEEDRPSKFLFSLRRGEVEAFLVDARGGQCWCSWRLRLGYTVGNQRYTHTIDAAGHPFETTGPSRAVYAQYHNEWQRLPPKRPRHP
jgi:hypothetical protein